MSWGEVYLNKREQSGNHLVYWLSSSKTIRSPLRCRHCITYPAKVEDMRGNLGSLSRCGPSWSSFRRPSTSLALWLKKSCFSEVRASPRSGHSSFSWLKNGSSPNRLVKAACWDITSASEDSSWQKEKTVVDRQPGSVVSRRLQGRGRTVVRDITPAFSPLYTPAAPVRPSLPAIFTPWAQCCLLACNSEVRNALLLMTRLKTAHGHILVCARVVVRCNLSSTIIRYVYESFQIIQGASSLSGWEWRWLYWKSMEAHYCQVKPNHGFHIDQTMYNLLITNLQWCLWISTELN